MSDNPEGTPERPASVEEAVARLLQSTGTDPMAFEPSQGWLGKGLKGDVEAVSELIHHRDAEAAARERGAQMRLGLFQDDMLVHLKSYKATFDKLVEVVRRLGAEGEALHVFLNYQRLLAETVARVELEIVEERKANTAKSKETSEGG